MKFSGFKVTVFAAALGLTACSNVNLPFYDEPIVLGCPNYYILEDAATLTKFADGAGSDITDIVVRAEMGQVRIACISEIDTDTNSGHMDLEIAPVIAAEMGAANETETADLSYFIVITDPDKEILYREELTMSVSFKNNRTRLIAVAPNTVVEIPITPEVRSRYYRVYAGFELTRAQVEYNRKRIQERLQ